MPGTANTTVDMKGALVPPKASTINKVRACQSRQTPGTDNPESHVVKILDEDTNSATPTVNHGASSGWPTDEVTLGSPLLVGDEAYAVPVQMRGVSAAVEAWFLWCEVEHTVPDMAVAL